MKLAICSAFLALALTAFSANSAAPSGDYLEVRSCDVFTGYCFANSEMNLTGKEATMLWSVRDGAWKGVKLGGLSVLAVVKSDSTLGDMQYQPRSGNAVLIVDAKADSQQREALADFARAMAGKLVSKVVDTKYAPIEAKLAACANRGCASVKAGDLVEIRTSCLGDKHGVCGNEETYYPPLSKVQGAYPVFTEDATFNGKGLDSTWEIVGKRSGFIATFSGENAAETRLAAVR